jgi:hypothetical protein
MAIRPGVIDARSRTQRPRVSSPADRPVARRALSADAERADAVIAYSVGGGADGRPHRMPGVHQPDALNVMLLAASPTKKPRTAFRNPGVGGLTLEISLIREAGPRPGV